MSVRFSVVVLSSLLAALSVSASESKVSANSEITITTKRGSSLTTSVVKKNKDIIEMTTFAPPSDEAKRTLASADYGFLIEKIKELKSQDSLEDCPRSFLRIEAKNIDGLSKPVEGCLGLEEKKSKSFDDFTFVIEAAWL